MDYLLKVYNYYFEPVRTNKDVLRSFAGLRPLLTGSQIASRASREYRILSQGKIISVFGGKWTTARALARKVAKAIGDN
jgi:glycerol-3-phosphate dehydrogenase